MSVIKTTLEIMEFGRERTLATLEMIEKSAAPQELLGFRPGPGRAHCAWHLMHVGITEELFATERLFGRVPAYAEMVPRFKGGSTPDDDLPSFETIRDVLDQSREHWRNALTTFGDEDLSVVPEPFRERGWTLGKILKVLVWHEAHHQGQAHAVINIWKGSQA